MNLDPLIEEIAERVAKRVLAALASAPTNTVAFTTSKAGRRLVDFAQHRITQAVWMYEIQRRTNTDILRSLHTEAVNAYLVDWQVKAHVDPALFVKFTIATE